MYSSTLLRIAWNRMEKTFFGLWNERLRLDYLFTLFSFLCVSNYTQNIMAHATTTPFQARCIVDGWWWARRDPEWNRPIMGQISKGEDSQKKGIWGDLKEITDITKGRSVFLRHGDNGTGTVRVLCRIRGGKISCLDIQDERLRLGRAATCCSTLWFSFRLSLYYSALLFSLGSHCGLVKVPKLSHPLFFPSPPTFTFCIY